MKTTLNDRFAMALTLLLASVVSAAADPRVDDLPFNKLLVRDAGQNLRRNLQSPVCGFDFSFSCTVNFH
jgi:hypothetical protein